jgi:hypothetical protein
VSRDYAIGAVRGELVYLLVKDKNDPMTEGRMWSAAHGLSDVKWVQEFLKFGYWDEYFGPPDKLDGLVPEKVFT